jgi:hypothetical protein
MKTEREYAESARDRLRRAESLIDLALRDVAAMGKINADAGRAREANAAFKARGMIGGARASLQVAHADSTTLLLDNWPDFGAEVTTRGPGR